MELKQINLKLSPNLVSAAESYARNFGFKNIQELASTSIREKIFQQNQFDETFTEEEVNRVDKIISKTLKEKNIIS